MIKLPFLITKTPLAKQLPKVKGKIKYNEPLKRYTWFNVGGPAEIFFEPHDEEDLALILKSKKNAPLTIIGGGSNLLVRDGGILGIVVKLSKNFAKISHEGETVFVGAATKNFQLCKYAMENNIGGFEFLSGIPGTIGGALKMNAGSCGVETKNIFVKARIMDGLGNIKEVSLDDLHYEYRQSTIPHDWVFLGATFKGYKKDKEEIKKTLDELKENREKAQPVGVKTAGSTFKNIKEIDMPAWKLIDKAGCRGLRVGGAVVSEKHCNFIINDNDATASDIEALGNKIIEKVMEVSGVKLEWEVKIIGIEKKVKKSFFQKLRA